MSKNDYLGIDGNTLRTFLTVLEESSVSRAAERLGVTQSAVSHTLDRLRQALDDPLFIRAGRGIEATTKAHELGKKAETILDGLKSLSPPRTFDPLAEEMEFTIAANDFPIQLIFPRVLNTLHDAGIKLRVRFIPAGIPKVKLLRASRYSFLITPTPPDDPDLIKVSLVKTKMEVFFDSKVRQAPETWKQFAESRYVEVRFSDSETSLMALPSINRSSINPPEISLPNFSLLPSMIKGTDRITTQLAAMKQGLLSDLNVAPLPFKTDSIDLFLVWHRREDDDLAHKWFRQKIIETAHSIVNV